MNNRKRVTLTFEIDEPYDYNEAFLRIDFLQELSCCVNDPYEDTFVMKVEDADAPHEMSAVEYGEIVERMCEMYGGSPCDCCPLGRAANCAFPNAYTITIAENWAREHPDET